MTKKLFINGRFLSPQKTGVQRYAVEVITAIDDLMVANTINQTDDVELICLVPPNTKDLPDWKKVKIEKTGLLTGNLWEQISLPLRVGNELLFSPINMGPFLTRKQIITIHDASVFVFPEAYSVKSRIKFKTFFKFAALTRKRIITVSEFSRKELEKYCFKHGQEITVIYHGHSHIKRMTTQYSTVVTIPEAGGVPYFLTVGSQTYRKNYQLLVKAMEIIQDLPTKVLIVGGTFPAVFRGEQIQEAVNLKCLGFVSDEKLLHLYQNAIAVILPSKYEGFGFPLVEALSLGVPVICSDIPAFKEVGNGFVEFFDPDSPQELVSYINSYFDGHNRSYLNGSVIEYLQKKFTWKQSGLKTWAVIRNELGL